MITLQIGLDRDLAMLLEREAHQLNLSVNDLAKHLLHQSLSGQEKPRPTIESIFGLIQSATDGQQFQRAMREE